MGIFERGTAQKIDIKARIDVADLLGQVGDPRLDDHNWVMIPGGTFWMGAQKGFGNGDPKAYGAEAPVHKVTLKGFRVGRFPVTVQEFARFVNAEGYNLRKFWEASEFRKFTEPDAWERQKQFPNRPVVGVSWFEASAYCGWVGGRLPTEAEWERVARGPNGSKYPWGEQPPLDHSRANYASAIGHPTPVGLFPEGNSPETISDLLGNVWEWCSDSYSAYQGSPQSNTVGPKKGEVKIVRGGSWSSNRRDVEASVLSGYERTNRGTNMGFRCVRELS